MKNKIAAIVVTYNRKQMLEECIQHLLAQVDAECDVLVIDNASTDGTQEHIKALIDGSKVKYFNTGANLGGAGGFQFGIKMAYELGYEFFWLMDDDTYAKPKSLVALVEAYRKRPDCGFLSSITKWTDGSLCNMNIQKTGIFKKELDFGKELCPIIMATFVSFFVSRRVVEDVGLPIKEFFIWADDLEYSRRISRKYPCFLATRSVVVHDKGSNAKVGIESDAIDRMWRYEYLY